jgi:limonene 1,2-monooxygenase
VTIPLRHGIFITPFHGIRENPTLSIERDLQLCEWCDELGFQEAWVGEHHSAGLEIIDSPEMFIAAAAERTKHIRFGTGVISLPYHHPLNVANRVIQLDHMTRGRFVFGAGAGLLGTDALMMGVEPELARDRLQQGLDVILRLLRGDTVTEATDWYTMYEARTHLRPFTVPYPEVCVASAVTPSGARIAGRYDLGMLCVAAGELTGYDVLDSNWKVACETAAKNGREMDRSRVRCVLFIHLSDSRRQAEADVRYGSEEFIRYLNNNQPRFDVPEGADYAEWLIEHKIGVVGTPDDAIQAVERVYEKLGEFGCVLLAINNCADWPATKRSLELYAQYVIPHFSDVNRNRVDSYAWATKQQNELVSKLVKAKNQAFAKGEADKSGQ